jgi:hypothetical protein
MTTPNPITWLTPAGSLGWIPDSIFYQTTLFASTPQLGEVIITATQSVTDIITCDSTEGLEPKQNIQFYGTSIGGIEPGRHYFVDQIVSSTQFTISDSPFASRQRITLTTDTGTMLGKFFQAVYYEIIAGELPAGIQCALNGVVSGIPSALASVQGVPLPVGANKTYKWTVQAYTEKEVNGIEVKDRINDRTFELTVVVSPGPNFVTPAGQIGIYYDSDEVDFQFSYTDPYEPDNTYVELVNGQLPGGLVLTPTGRLHGYIQPTPDILALAGYDQPTTPYDDDPYDFVAQFLSKDFQFTLRVTNGKKSELRTFSIYVYSRDQMGADDSVLVDNNTFLTSDETRERAPFIVNSEPSNLGIYRSENYFAYQFVAEDYDSNDITYAISVNEGFGLPPGLSLDPISGWYYGYIPDQGTTETTYSFNIAVYQTDPVTPSVVVTSTSGNVMTVQGTGQLTSSQPLVFGANFAGLTQGTIYYVDTVISESAETNTTEINIQGQTLSNATGLVTTTLAIECTASSSTTNCLTCFSTGLFEVGQPIVFTGTSFGGVSVSAQTIYYVHSIPSTTEFSIATTPTAASPVQLTTGSGSMLANMIVTSRLYPFTMTITGAIDAEVTWITPNDSTAYYKTINGVSTLVHDLGTIDNGDTSRFYVEAVNRGGRTLEYRLKSGAFNELPQGLKLLPTGEIAGRVSFDTFSLDLGATTFDESLYLNRNTGSLGTTFDSTFVFTVNAYAPENTQIIYKVAGVDVVDGGSGYSSINLPVIEFSTPIGASAVQAQAGNVVVTSGAITSVEVAVSGDGYTSPATITIPQGFGGSGANLVAVMQASGSKDVVSVFRTCSIKVVRRYNKPYQNLYIRAMPPEADRALIRELLDDDQILVPDYIYRPDDPNFGKSTQVTYYHAFGLAPDTLERYVASLYENHYYKNLTLGEILTAQAVDPVTNQIVYEVVYSKIVDNLVNDAGESVSKIVNLPYTIIDPRDGSTVISQVYPNSLVDMRNQVIDVVGQVSTKLPLWMTSKQPNGRILGFTPAWVIAYTKPGRSNQISYYINRYYGQQLNLVDFGVERYILDRILSKNWDTETQHWTPEASITTFDRYNVGGLTFDGVVSIATNLAYADVNNRTLEYVNNLGGFDGIVLNIENNTIIFAKQESYDGPPGSSYATTQDAWFDYFVPFDSGETEGSEGSFDAAGFDEAVIVPNGDAFVCTQTIAATDTIVCPSTTELRIGQPIEFTADVIGGIVEDQRYYIYSIESLTGFKITETQGGASPVSLSDDVGSMTAKPANERMAIYRMNIDTDGLIKLTLVQQTYEDEYVQIQRGNFYRSANLYYPGAPAPGLTRISWQFLQTVTTVETIFDQGSLAFIEPVDMYDPTDTIDKYLVFPKQNILV